MLTFLNFNSIRFYWRNFNQQKSIGRAFVFLFGILMFLSVPCYAQGPVNGGFEGKVIEKGTGTPLTGAVVQFINNANGFQTAKRSDQNGNFRQDTLQPGVYLIRVNLAGYKPFEKSQELYATRTNSLVPVPVELEKEETVSVITTPLPTPVVTNPDNPPVATPSPVPAAVPTAIQTEVSSDTDEGANLNPRRDAAFNAAQVSTLPLGGTTLTRSFDELALLAPGVAPPPQAIGNSVGPGVGGGVGTSGQFAVNGLRSRANNFTVDGSDNNDEDIGVRRQGFFSLVPQPIESIQEFQIITLLAPAQYGRNLGAQVNALSKSGGNEFHGTLFGFANASQLNARNPFDNAGGDTTSNLTGRRTNGVIVPVFINGTQAQVNNNAGEKDSFTLAQGGFAVGGRFIRDKMFFFVSGEGQSLNATQEKSFAVPTTEQRGFVNSGVSGLQQCLGEGGIIGGLCVDGNGNPVPFAAGFPTSLDGDAVFSLFPFPNNPGGIYGRNTYSQALSADARGLILSGKVDYNFNLFDGRPQSLTARYNFTDDERDLPTVGGAIFSSIRPLVRTNNFSTFLSGGVTDNVSNEIRFSWGRTDLDFEELRDTSGFILPVSRSFSNSADSRFLLNARRLVNNTFPPVCSPTGCSPATQANYMFSGTTESNSRLGLVGQVIIAGFSPVGVDVFNFPQQRTNDTFQFADTVRWQVGRNSLAFGADIRRTFLESNLPRNSRPLVTFNGALDFTGGSISSILAPVDLAAMGAATGFFQTLALPGNDASIDLSYNQLNFFGQDELRLRPNLLLSFGLRYEYNTTPHEANDKIENSFSQSLPSFLAGLSRFINGRTEIFEADKNNFAPRFGFAYAPTNKTVIRGGYGIYFDQILGAVVSQSRNVFPTFNTLNFGGGIDPLNEGFRLFNPINTTLGGIPIVNPNSVNSINSQINVQNLISTINMFFPRENGTAFGTTLPQRRLNTPLSHQYSIGFEQELFNNIFLSVAYVGTSGRDLLRFTTPNLGSNFLPVIDEITLRFGQEPRALGTTFAPFSNPNTLERPVANAGPVEQFETTGNSQYDALQFELRGRLLRNALQYQASYVFGSVEDDVSDVFDLAGAFALPQNSQTFAGEYAPANFDVRHRFTYGFIYDLPSFNDRGGAFQYLLGGWQFAGTGRYNTGQPFTVNTIFDVNLDGNLTDRLNSTQSIIETGDRRQPIALANNTNLMSLLAPLGQDGIVPRNSFRAGSILDLDLAFIKRFVIREGHILQFRTDIFNFINRANYGIPVRFLESPGFGRATDTVTPGRRIQFALKYNF